MQTVEYNTKAHQKKQNDIVYLAWSRRYRHIAETNHGLELARLSEQRAAAPITTNIARLVRLQENMPVDLTVLWDIA